MSKAAVVRAAWLLIFHSWFQQIKGLGEFVNLPELGIDAAVILGLPPHVPAIVGLPPHVPSFLGLSRHVNVAAENVGRTFFIPTSVWQNFYSKLNRLLSSIERRAATVTISPGSNANIRGQLDLYRVFGKVLIAGEITGLNPGLHGFHVHEGNDLGNQCKNAKGHFNPFGVNHGSPQSSTRHVGDLGNIEADSSGRAVVHILDRIISLTPNAQEYIGNRAIVIHAGQDDLGLGGNSGSLATGNAGSRDGCGVIRLL